MSLRERQQSSPATAAILALVLLAIPASFLAWWYWPREVVVPQKKAYFYDLNTNELIVMPAGTLGPVETPSGPYKGMPAGVRANVFCCGPFMEGTEKFIGHLEVPLKAVPEDQRPPGMVLNPEIEGRDFVIRRSTDNKWYDPDSEEGLLIFREAGQKCPGKGKPLVQLAPLSD